LLLNVTVYDGVVDLWGIALSGAERKAVRIAAESTPGVRTINDNIVTCPLNAGRKQGYFSRIPMRQVLLGSDRLLQIQRSAGYVHAIFDDHNL
jgi:hypothetical protein